MKSRSLTNAQFLDTFERLIVVGLVRVVETLLQIRFQA